VDVSGNKEVEATLTTTDDGGGSSTDTMNVTVNDLDSVAPSVSITDVNDQSELRCNTILCTVNRVDFTVDWSGTDPESDIQNATVELVDSTGTVVDSQTYTYSGSSSIAESTTLQVNGGYGEEYTIKVGVTDSVPNTEDDSEDHDADGDDTGTPP